MSDRVIEVRDVSKQYRLGMVGTGTLSHDLNRWWAKVRGKEDPYSRVGQVNKRDQKAESDYVWALKDINFDVHRGEILGIIGANGAGKSTLLKLMSRITAPTTGHIRSKGRIASLLEVGTGMHPEMTARENIYLNGSIMGMRRHEITRKFDDIIDFAGCQMYVDTPVKRFSSGMKVRLGFAVAAFLEPEILIVDEVLAVGDAEFQRKCLGKMQDITQGGDRTILFVSHNLDVVARLCSRVLILEHGEVEHLTSDVDQGIVRYTRREGVETWATRWENEYRLHEHPSFTPLAFSLCDSRGVTIDAEIDADDEVYIQIEAEIQNYDPALTIGYAIYSENRETIYWSYHTDRHPDEWPELREGRWLLKSKLPARLLNVGTYRVELLGGLHNREWFFQPGAEVPALQFSIRGGFSDSPMWNVSRPGHLAPSLSWDSEPLARQESGSPELNGAAHEH